MRLLSVLFWFGMANIPMAFGQTYSLTGHVKDQENIAIPYATVYLLKTTDSTLVAGTSADENGYFIIQTIPPDVYLVKASYVGQSSNPLPMEIMKDTRIGALIIDQNEAMLDGVTVTATRPVIERKVDRIVFTVENSVLSQDNTWDILRKTPGVIVMQGQLNVRNQPATIYINDRKVQLSNDEVRELLENNQGTNIKSIEVIHNPPAKYDADGGAILNIIMDKNISLGYKGNISSTYTQGIFPKYNFGTSQFYKTKKLNINANYAYVPKKEFMKVDGRVNFRDDTGIFTRWHTDFDKTSRYRTHVAGLALDYDFDGQNTINLTANAQLSPKRSHTTNQETTATNREHAIDSTFTTGTFMNEDKNIVSGDVTYIHKRNENNSLKFNTHYTHFDFSRSQDANSNYFNPSGNRIRSFSFLTDADQSIQIITSQLDYSHTLGTLELNIGGKGSFINSSSRLDFYDKNGATTLVPQLSDNFNYDEKVLAGYASFSKDWEKWSVKAGLRAEQTHSKGTSVALSTINDLSYFKWFPSFYLLHTINEKHSISLDYSRKLTRPRYEDLNPFRTFISENNYIEGNPNLLPSFSNNINLNYTFDQTFFFDFYYRDNGHYISMISYQDNQHLILKDINQNVLSSTSYGLDFNYGKDIGNFWYVYSYLSVFHEDETFLALESDAYSATNSINGIYIDVTNYLTLSKDGTFKGLLGVAYLSGFIQGSYKQAQTTNVTAGFRKSIWKGRASISVNANDILGMANSRVTSRYLNQDNSYLSVPETQHIRLGFIYNFGNYRLEDNSREIDNKETERLKKDP